MKKTISFVLAIIILCITAVSMPVSAEAVIQKVTIDAPADTIVVKPGDKNVEVTWTITENEGWGIFKCYVEFNGDVFSFVPGEQVVAGQGEGPFEFFKGDIVKYLQNMGVVTPNIYGIQSGVDPTITKDRSSFLIEGKSNTDDVTATGDFFTIYLNIADDAQPGIYDIKVIVDENNCSSMKGPSVAVPSITFGTAKVEVIGGSEISQNDPRLNVEGAQIRVPSSVGNLPEQGIRFVSTITPDLYNILKETDSLPQTSSDKGVGFGTVVLPTSMIPAGESLTKETENAAIVPAVLLFEAPTDTAVTYTACMVDIKKENYTKEYTVVPYVTYMDEGKKVTLYGDSYSTSIFEVAKAVFEDESNTEYIREYVYNNILHVVDPDTYPEDRWTGTYRP